MPDRKRCKFCGHEGTRMIEMLTAVLKRPDGHRCSDRVGCARRRQQLGQWVGTRVLRRRDLDGTEWTIRDAGCRLDGSGERVYSLICEFRQHRTVSLHHSIDAAKAHRDDLVASWQARRLRDYTEARR